MNFSVEFGAEEARGCMRMFELKYLRSTPRETARRYRAGAEVVPKQVKDEGPAGWETDRSARCVCLVGVPIRAKQASLRCVREDALGHVVWPQNAVGRVATFAWWVPAFGSLALDPANDRVKQHGKNPKGPCPRGYRSLTGR